MTKAQRADALLCAAKHWQNEGIRGFCGVCIVPCVDLVLDCIGDESESGIDWHWLWASAALSEVAGLGYELESVEP